jgi:hypothetical protein
MPRQRSLTSTFYRAARLNNRVLAARRGSSVCARRVARYKTNRKTLGATRQFLTVFGLGR